jgi:hypothetical protein
VKSREHIAVILKSTNDIRVQFSGLNRNRSELNNYRQKFVSKFNFYWKERCNLTKIEYRTLGITKKVLSQNKGVKKYNLIRVKSEIPKYTELLGIHNNIYFGVNHWILQYTWILLT